MTELIVEHWTLPNDANHRNQHARVTIGEQSVEFFAFPYQGYLSDHINQMFACVGSRWSFGRGVTIRKFIDGDWKSVDHKIFEEENDEPFIWATKKLLEIDDE